MRYKGKHLEKCLENREGWDWMKMKKVFYVVGVGCEECTKKDKKMPSFKEKPLFKRLYHTQLPWGLLLNQILVLLFHVGNDQHTVDLDSSRFLNPL